MTDRTDDLVSVALAFGFEHAALMDPAAAAVRPEVREMCAANLCGSFGRSWSCPPACGTLDNSRRLLAGYGSGLLVQTTGTLEDAFDYDTMVALGELQKQRLMSFRAHLRPRFPRLTALGNGACTVCNHCTYPVRPCVHPDQMLQSMEAAGLVVSDVCVQNGLGYYYGPGTLTYTGCLLLEPRRDGQRASIPVANSAADAASGA